MATKIQLQKISLALPEATEEPHFDKTSFRVKGKIFATYNDKEKWATLRFTPEEQAMFCKIGDYIFPVPNAWGRLGWTHIRIGKIKVEVLKELLKAAYIVVAPKKLAETVKDR